jgi:hypothetical protein
MTRDDFFIYVLGVGLLILVAWLSLDLLWTGVTTGGLWGVLSALAGAYLLGQLWPIVSAPFTKEARDQRAKAREEARTSMREREDLRRRENEVRKRLRMPKI